MKCFATLAVMLFVVSGCGDDDDGSGEATDGGGASAVDESRCEANRAAGAITYVSPFGFHASPGILDVFAADELGYFDEMCLDVEIVPASQNATALVSAGRAHVTTINTAATFLTEVANGANAVAVATYADASIYAILTAPDITELTQLEGRTLGYHFVMPATILLMLQAAGVDVDNVDLINTPNFDPHQIVQGHLDGITAYQSNEPLVLRNSGEEFNQFDAQDFDIESTFNLQIVNKDFLEEHRQAAADFMRAELHAFDYCSREPAECIAILEDAASEGGADFDSAHQAEIWAVESQLVIDSTDAGSGVGVHTQSQWQSEVDALERFNLVDAVPSLEEHQDTTLVADLYDGGELVWP